MNHDNGYKLLFSHAEMVADLLRGFVHEDWVARLDFTSLERVNASYVSDSLRGRCDDVVWRVRYSDRWLYVYLLLEFQSTDDPWMALRIWAYVALLYQDLVRGKQLGLSGRLPPVLPIVLYNGERPWQAAVEVGDLVEEVPGGLDHYRPRMRYFLLDEGRIVQGELQELKNLAAALFRLEQSREPEDILRVVRSLLVWLAAPEQASLNRAFTVWVEKVLMPARLPGVGIPHLHNLTEAETMLAERVKKWTEDWKAQGLEKGLEQGLEKGLEKGLKKGLEKGRQEGESGARRAIARALLDVIADDALLAERTGLAVEEIKAMRFVGGH